MFPDNPDVESVSEDTEILDTEQESTEDSDESQDSTEASSDVDGGTSKDDKWFVEGRFRTADDVLKSYQHLESHSSRLANELHRLKSNQVQNTDPKKDDEDFARAVQLSPVQAVRNVAEKAAREARLEAKQIRLESEHARLMGNSEYVELQPVMQELTAKYAPMLSEDAQHDPATLHALFYMAKGLKADEIARKAETRGKKTGEQAAMRKTKAQVEGNSGSKGAVKRKFEDLSLADMRKELAKGHI